jgi:hypothetical protein
MTDLKFARCACGVVGILLLAATVTRADVTVAGLDALILNPAYNDNPSGDLVSYGALSNASNPGAITFNGFDSFTIDTKTGVAGSHFGGIGARIAGEFGTTFNPANYELQFTYKLGPNNVADNINIVMSQHDGFSGFNNQGEDFVFAMNDLISQGSTTDFVTITRDITLLPNPVTGSVFDPWDGRQQSTNFALDGDMEQDYDSYEADAPNGLWRTQIQTIFGTTERANLIVKDVRLVPKTAEPEAVRFDGNTGHARTTDFYTGGVNHTGQVIDIDATVPSQFASGFAFTSMRTPVSSFDGNAYAIEFTAKLGPSNTMGGVSVILKDLDGNDNAGGQGAEEWAYFFNANQLNTSTFTTLTRLISLPDSGLPSKAIASGFSFSGDGSVADFDLYQMFIANEYGFSYPNPPKRLDMEIQSIKIVPLAVDNADFNNNGLVDGPDFLAWQRGFGTTSGATRAMGDANGDGKVNAADLTIWRNQYGTSPLVALAFAVPEPATPSLLVFCVAVLFVLRFKSRSCQGQ